MDRTLHRTLTSLHFLPSHNPLKQSSYFRTCYSGRRKLAETSSLVVVARTGSSHCEPSSSLNTPLEPKSPAGKFLSSVFQNQRQLFHAAVADELKVLADDRDSAVSRMFLSSASDEASLHRRIAQLKENECQAGVEDVMYMLIFYKFSEIRVPLVPKLSRCIYNGRLEIWPTKDWELETIHRFEALEMIREHVSTIIGLRANSSVTDYWSTTEIKLVQLGRVYAASILYGYFLKSASIRHHLEHCLCTPLQDIRPRHRTLLQFPDSSPYVVGRTCNTQATSSSQNLRRHKECKRDSLRYYVMDFDAETLQRCAKPKSKEAVNLIEKHSSALLGDENTDSLKNDEAILTSFSSLKRLVLEGVAFGSFLWDAEEYVNSVYKLKDN